MTAETLASRCYHVYTRTRKKKELEITAVYLAGMDESMGKERKPLTGKTAKIYAIATLDELSGEDEYCRV